MSSNNDEEFKFIFDDKKELSITKNSIIEISPTFYFKNINNNEQNIIKMPKYIGYNDLDNYIKLFQRYISRLRQFNFDESFISIKLLLEGYSTNISKLIQISEYFENNSFSIILIKDCLLADNKEKEKENINNINNLNHKMNIDNAIILLYLSYNKLKEINSKDRTNLLNKNSINNIEEELESTWLDLFIKSLDIIGKNLNYYFENDNDDSDNFTNNKLWSFDRKIIDELYEKFAYNLILKNFIINTHNLEIESNLSKNCIDLKELNKIINFLIKKRNQNDFFSLLSNEFMKIISEENINELNSLPNPTFILKINVNDINNYYEEYSINNSFNLNDNIKIIIVVYYKKNEDTFNVALKLSKDKNDKTNISFDIITYLSLALIEEIDNKQINVKSLSFNKSMYEILKITNFTKIISEKNHKNEYLTLKIFLKPCYTYTMLTNYLFYNLENLDNNKNISKLSKNLLNIIIQKKQLIKNDETNLINSNSDKDIKNNNADKIVNFLINWLNDEINIGEDISEIIKNIKWEYVSLPLLFEFLIKYSNHIVTDDLEFIYSNSLFRILNKFDGNINLLAEEIIHSIIIAAKKMNYISIFCENKKIKKFNLYELMNQKRNISSQLDIKQPNNENNNKQDKINNKSNNINKNEINMGYDYKNKYSSKENTNINKKEEIIIKRKIKIGNNNSPIENKYLSNNKNKSNISFINNSDICYNNYFTNCNNNFNINIKLNDKFKKNNSNINKKKIIISHIKIRKNNTNKDNNIKCIKKENITPNKKYTLNNSFFTPKIKVKLDKFNSNNALNNTINFQNLKNIDKLLMKNKFDKNKNKRNNNIYNYSDIKNKTYNEGNSYFNIKKYNHQKNNNNSIENNNNKYDKHKKHISLLNELLKLNKKGKRQNIFPINKNLNNNNQSLNIKKHNLTQVNVDNKLLKNNNI